MLPFLEPFTAEFVLRALLGGVVVAALCGIVGTWVVARGLAFLGEALAHGMLPGVATAVLLGLPPVLGAAVSAAAMSAGIGWVARRGRLSHDTSIALLFVGMLALGVIIVSRSRSFAVDVTAILFGDILAIGWPDIQLLLIALGVTIVVAAFFHRSFVALAVDPRLASVLGLRPRLAQVVLVGLVTLAVVAAYGAVGSLLVVALLVAPAVAAGRWVRRLPSTMVLATAFGAVAVYLGLLASWYLDTAAGASIAGAAVLLAGVSAAARAARDALRRPDHAASATPAAHDLVPDESHAHV
jgi:zinc/manganese transport system permease protein